MNWATVLLLVAVAYGFIGCLMVVDVAAAKRLSVPHARACAILFLPLAMWYFHALPSKRE